VSVDKRYMSLFVVCMFEAFDFGDFNTADTDMGMQSVMFAGTALYSCE